MLEEVGRQRARSLSTLSQFLSIAIALPSICLGTAQESSRSPDNPKLLMPVEVPIRSEKGADGSWKPMIAARIADIDVECVIDTGGESSILPKKFLQQFPRREEKTITDSNGERRAYGVGPADLVFGKNKVGKFSFVVVGDYLRLTNGKETWDANGPTLGIDVLGNFRVRIDGPKGRLTLGPDDGPLEGSGWVAYAGFNGTPHQTVEAKTAKGDPLRLFLDTGYAQSRIVRKFSGSTEMPLQISVGDARVEAVAAILNGDADLRITSPGKEDIVIHATLGWDVLRHFVLELSPANKRLRLSKGD